MTVPSAYELGRTVSPSMFRKVLGAPSSIAFIGINAFVSNDVTLTLFNFDGEAFEHVPFSTWYFLNLPVPSWPLRQGFSRVSY